MTPRHTKDECLISLSLQCSVLDEALKQAVTEHQIHPQGYSHYVKIGSAIISAKLGEELGSKVQELYN
jgi:hypothetical protein